MYLWRGGSPVGPELVNFQGEGPPRPSTSWTVPYLAAGIDSVAVDPALFSISFLDRVEVERWPALRVYLFTRRHDLGAPRSRLGIARGDRRMPGRG